MTTPRRVRSTDGVELAVFESGDPQHPTIVAIHGYPDNHHVWDGVVDVLAQRYHVVTYDVRGAGESDQPRGRAAYRMTRLTDDFLSVLDAVSPSEPVHLLAHDWGSIQSWPALADPRVAGRVASFTSISGPSLDHAGAWLRNVPQHPRATAGQLGHSFYVFLFQLPVLPELAARSGMIQRGIARLAQRAGSATTTADQARTAHDAVNGIQLYRANMLSRIGRPRPEHIDIPVQVLAPEDDPHVGVTLQTEAPKAYVTNLRTRVISGGHWVVAQQPAVIAEYVEEFLASIGSVGAASSRRSRS